MKILTTKPLPEDQVHWTSTVKPAFNLKKVAAYGAGAWIGLSLIVDYAYLTALKEISEGKK